MPDLPAQTAPAAPAPFRKVWLLVLPLAALAAAGWWLMSAASPPGLLARFAASPVSDPVFVPLEPFTVNLQPNGRARFLHLAVTLKVPEVKAQALLLKYLPEVRSRVLTVLANREADALLLPEVKLRLAADIRAALEQPLAPGLATQPITNVMFTTFMLQ